MTATLNTPAALAKDVTSTRRRRRRAPVGGAAEDCFTCAKRFVKCDRRRPYCSQCLEIGDDCSGYKTQLTWGVGVASRGKLRGLSLPIAKSPPVKAARGVVKSPTRTQTNRTAIFTGAWADAVAGEVGHVGNVGNVGHIGAGGHTHEDGDGEQARHGNGIRRMTRTGPMSVPTTSTTTPTNYQAYNPQMPLAGNVQPSARSTWTQINYLPVFVSHKDECRSTGGQMNLSMTLEPSRTLIGPSLESMGELGYLSPLKHLFPSHDLPPVRHSHDPTVLYDSHSTHSSPTDMAMGRRRVSTCPSLLYSCSVATSSLQSQQSQPSHGNGFDAPNFWPSHDEDDALAESLDEHGSLAVLSSSMPPSPPWSDLHMSHMSHMSHGIMANMSFFIDYYDKTMCPRMVFIDGPRNPFRLHILQLSASSRSLQHAICALAACNLRMRRLISLGQRAVGRRERRRHGSLSAGLLHPLEDDSLAEEDQHRNVAVHLLNQQLMDPDKSRHDSVLATILLLCHYRMAESGVARFRTQFAGVKKILSIRQAPPFPAPAPAPTSTWTGDSAWMEALFTYFDAISANINDREAQLNSSSHELLPDPQLLPPGAENLVGCDRDLFKTIAKLGRLNLLSQRRPVQSRAGRAAEPSPSVSPPTPPLGHTLDGQYGQPSSSGHPPNGDRPGTIRDEDDHRTLFWREWKEARFTLQSWEFDPSRVLASLTPSHMPSPTEMRDLSSLSQAFRYAALLYTERLASPHVPSQHANFRNLVNEVVYFATSLEAGSRADKFLLWPLFVAGSECVNELQQNVVRAKCRDIMARSGYMNNLAALDVLERLWAGDGKVRDGAKGPLIWTSCLGRPDVEVEWIMF